MGKSKKIKISKDIRSCPLDQQIAEELAIKPKDRRKTRNVDNDEKQSFIDPKLSTRILSAARKQQTELEDEFGSGSGQKKRTTLTEDSDQSEDESAVPEEYYEELKISEEDEKALEVFMNKDGVQRKTLAEIIAEKIREKETEIESRMSETDGLQVEDMDEKVLELYRGVKTVLGKYRSGKLPKAFKIIPALSNWEQVLAITEPDGWTAAAMMAATRIFTSNLRERMAQRFFCLVLLPRLRDDILEYRRLNFHLYGCLRKALFKSGAFFKGIVLPLLHSNCTLREAVIIGSVVAKHHIPVLHACAAMLKIAEMDYSGSNSVFLHILLQKKFALPYRVVDGLVYHFLRFSQDKRALPVLWHQCLLVFVHNYKQDLSGEQRDAILELLRHQNHHKISSEIRRELLNSRSRDDEDVSRDCEGVVVMTTE